MKENDFSKQDIYNIGFAVADAVRDYDVTYEGILDAIQVYAEQQELIGNASLYDTLWMEDGTTMSPSLTRYLFHEMYCPDDYGYDEEDGDDE